MQKTIVTALAILASTAAAVAADLPSKSTSASSPTPAFVQNQGYVGASLSSDLGSARAYSGGVVAGWNANSFLAVESTYNLARPDQKVLGKFNYRNTIAINAVPQYRVPGTDATVYAFGGLGYRWNTASTVADHSVYNVGVGMKYEIAKNLELDSRYTRIESVKDKYRTSSPAEDRVSVGVNYRF